MRKNIIILAAAAVLITAVLAAAASSGNRPGNFVIYNGNCYAVLYDRVKEELIGGKLGETQKSLFNSADFSSNCLDTGTPLYEIKGFDGESPKAIAHFTHNSFRLAVLPGSGVLIDDSLTE